MFPRSIPIVAGVCIWLLIIANVLLYLYTMHLIYWSISWYFHLQYIRNPAVDMNAHMHMFSFLLNEYLLGKLLSHVIILYKPLRSCECQAISQPGCSWGRWGLPFHPVQFVLCWSQHMIFSWIYKDNLLFFFSSLKSLLPHPELLLFFFFTSVSIISLLQDLLIRSAVCYTVVD